VSASLLATGSPSYIHTYFEHITPVRTLTQSYPYHTASQTHQHPSHAAVVFSQLLPLSGSGSAATSAKEAHPLHHSGRARDTHQPDPSHVTLDPPSGLSYPGSHLQSLCSCSTGLEVIQTARFYSILGAHCLWIPADLVVLSSLAYHHNDAERETPHNQLSHHPIIWPSSWSWPIIPPPVPLYTLCVL
jgi:hypothetical protein